MKIDSLIETLRSQDHSSFSLDDLYDLLLKQDLSRIELADIVPEVKDQHNYSRNILMMDPMEVVILAWPPGVASAIHHHEGFWGVVAVLEGQLDNISYKFHGDKLLEGASERGIAGGLIREEDGVIHKLQNTGESIAVTAHFYCPPLTDFGGMRIFDLKQGRIGVLSDKAETASWQEPEGHFEHIEENAFRYVPLSQREEAPSHKVHPIIPKPEREVIEELIGEYYAEQAHNYDHFDTTHASRSKYTQAVNQLIADDLKDKEQLDSLLSIACGTGRRVSRIKALSGRSYQIFGVDLSEEMCQIAYTRGIHTFNSKWMDVDLDDRLFDAVTFLYAFGHVSTRADRSAGLRKIAQHLRPGGRLYMDVFNVNDRNEWGPKAVRLYERLKLDAMGYERGDVFYRKTGGQATAYLHYFEESDITELLEEAGLRVVDIVHVGYTVKPGEILKTENEGALFIIAERPKSKKT